jgi:hypothetical protein
MYWTAQLLPCIVVPCAVRGMAACRSSRRQRKSALVKAKPSPRRGHSSRREPPRVGMRTTSPLCPCSAGPNRSWPTCETELRGAQASKARPVLGASRGNGFSSHPFQRSRVGGGGAFSPPPPGPAHEGKAGPRSLVYSLASFPPPSCFPFCPPPSLSHSRSRVRVDK